MDLASKDAYIAEHLMKLGPDTLRFMVADLTAEVERLTADRDRWRLAAEEAQGEVRELTELVKGMAVSAVNVQQGARDMVKFSDDRALEFKHEADSLRAQLTTAREEGRESMKAEALAIAMVARNGMVGWGCGERTVAMAIRAIPIKGTP